MGNRFQGPQGTAVLIVVRTQSQTVPCKDAQIAAVRTSELWYISIKQYRNTLVSKVARP